MLQTQVYTCVYKICTLLKLWKKQESFLCYENNEISSYSKDESMSSGSCSPKI